MTKYTKQDLAEWMADLHDRLIDNNPAAELDEFFDIQEEQEFLEMACRRSGYTFEEVEDLYLQTY